jgi:hypothetical protein
VKKSAFESMARVFHAELSGVLLIAVLRQLRDAAGRWVLVPEKMTKGREIVPFQKFGPPL